MLQSFTRKTHRFSRDTQDRFLNICVTRNDISSCLVCDWDRWTIGSWFISPPEQDTRANFLLVSTTRKKTHPLSPFNTSSPTLSLSNPPAFRECIVTSRIVRRVLCWPFVQPRMSVPTVLLPFISPLVFHLSTPLVSRLGLIVTSYWLFVPRCSIPRTFHTRWEFLGRRVTLFFPDKYFRYYSIQSRTKFFLIHQFYMILYYSTLLSFTRIASVTSRIIIL